MDCTLKITDKNSADFVDMTKSLMGEYVALYGDEALEFCPGEALEEVLCAAVAYQNDEPAASGAIRALGTAAELMRVYVRPECRGQGLGTQIVNALEAQAAARGFSRIMLVTGLDMPAALALYQGLGYTRMECYGPMKDDPLCICLEKQLNSR